MTSPYHCNALLLIGLLLTNIGSAQDAELLGMMQSYQRQVRELQVRELANYADQLDQLRKAYAEKGDTRAEQQAVLEYTRILVQIKAAIGKSAASASSNVPSPNPINVETVFQLSTEDAAKTPATEREPTVLEFHQGKLIPDATGRKFWTKADDAIHWTIPTLPAGKYRIRLSYRTPKEDGGGRVKLSVSGVNSSLAHQISASEKSDGAVSSKEIGRLELTSFPAELSLKLLDTPHMSQPLFELFTVKLIYEEETDSAKSQRNNVERERKKQPQKPPNE